MFMKIVLAIRYRVRDSGGSRGPMIFIIWLKKDMMFWSWVSHAVEQHR